ACGRPVVASAVGGIPEIIRSGENGFLVSEDLQELSSRIVELLSSPELAERLASKAMADVAARFTWTHATERFLPLYGVPSRHRVAITVDLERDYQAPARSFRGVEEAMPKILALFEGHGVRATVFATSDLCDRFPDALMEIRRRGHALGCHGESHDIEYLSAQPYEWQLESLRRATKAIEAIAQSAADPCVFLVHPWELIDPAPGPIPEWMRTGCTSDTSNLDAFLARVRLEHDLTTLDAELAGIR